MRLWMAVEDVVKEIKRLAEMVEEMVGGADEMVWLEEELERANEEALGG